MYFYIARRNKRATISAKGVHAMDVITLVEQVFNQNGLIAAMFVGVLFWILKTNNERETRLTNQNDEREKRYIVTIDNLTVKVSDKINKIENDIGEIKDIVKQT